MNILFYVKEKWKKSEQFSLVIKILYLTLDWNAFTTYDTIFSSYSDAVENNYQQ